MTHYEGLLYINIVVCVIAIIVRTGINIDGTGWLETLLKTRSRNKSKREKIGNEQEAN